MITVNEKKGFVLVTTLLIMLVLTLVGIGAILTSSVEMDISRNERLQKEAFYAADAGGAVVPRVINIYLTEQPANNDALPEDLQPIAIDDGLLNEINGTGYADNVGDNPDLQLVKAGKPVFNIDIDRIATVQPTGQDIVFLGESGVATPVNIYYRTASRGFAADNRFVDIDSFYRFIPMY